MKTIDLAQEIHRDLEFDSNLSQSAIAYWLREHIGDLNNLLGLNITINSDSEFSESLSEQEKSIYKKLYELYNIGNKIKGNLGASGTNTVVEVDDFGTKIRLVSKNEIAKTWLQLRKQLQEELKSLIFDYNKNSFSPVGIYGDDAAEGNNCSNSTTLVFPVN